VERSPRKQTARANRAARGNQCSPRGFRCRSRSGARVSLVRADRWSPYEGGAGRCGGAWHRPPGRVRRVWCPWPAGPVVQPWG